MNKKHRYVELSKISVGAILAEDLLDKQGHVLLPAGTALSAAMLKAMAHHEIHHLPLLNTDEEETQTTENPVDSAAQEQRLDRLHHIFRHITNETAPESATAILKNYLESYRRGDA
ncbi:hypothetical protein H8K33_06270 [Undibacterium amnicola]|uniref:Uncharacterized protein n=1 Tax=Undibacterium amnicola TaxID=1834038 RepID=A0ABR6XNM1_9BURK|nr:hypothetical protein [Undibacterium amnicola]MBC3831103.1 hypothetical protein [Undibacterium amnicola]